MKFYISSRVKDKNEVQEIIKDLKDKGHEITLDWTHFDSLRPYDEYENKSKKHSISFFKAIEKADVFILISNEAGTGMYTELGIALKQHLYSEKPSIYIIGDHLSRSIFFFHPSVNRVSNLEEVLDDLNI